ncbi:RNA-binding protein Cwf29 [Malassezia yamatoensis]|uniref:RNA-binding protein Cwf29 n=1 Tax=Malassezia yamatoensis TaxID=253288 RepID=A0AAJ5YWA8_9BASI|nr:RNA-binding protein Cwf29 [Malassezia yamatoensis]
MLGMIDTDSAYIYVGGLPFDATEGDVITIFSQYGEVMNIHLPRPREGSSKDAASQRQGSEPRRDQKPKHSGFGFLMYEDQRSTVLAVDNLNGAQVLGRTLRVDHVLNYKPERVPDAEGNLVEPDKQTFNCAPPETILDSDQDQAQDTDQDLDLADPMAAYFAKKNKDRKRRSREKHSGEHRSRRHRSDRADDRDRDRDRNDRGHSRRGADGHCDERHKRSSKYSGSHNYERSSEPSIQSPDDRHDPYHRSEHSSYPSTSRTESRRESNRQRPSLATDSASMSPKHSSSRAPRSHSHYENTPDRAQNSVQTQQGDITPPYPKHYREDTP